jgi:hypothetical protein
MIELKDNELVFTFPQVHKAARTAIEFQRTLRIPDDGETYGLPPGLGSFPLRHVEDYSAKVPADWNKRGGVMLPMYQSEAMWIYFRGGYPCAIKVATGKINAVNGKGWEQGLSRHPQNYVVSSEQPWLDGYCVKKGMIRQFVAMPLGSGYTAEEQLTGAAEFGGIQIEVFPLKAEKWEAMQNEREMVLEDCRICCFSTPMGLAPGGLMRQTIYDDPFKPGDWDLEHSSRCFIHICNSMLWESITGARPPHPPVTAAAYTEAGLPWFEYYSEKPGCDGSAQLNALKSVNDLGKEKGETPLPENESIHVSSSQVVHINKQQNQVSEW